MLRYKRRKRAFSEFQRVLQLQKYVTSNWNKNYIFGVSAKNIKRCDPKLFQFQKWWNNEKTY